MWPFDSLLLVRTWFSSTNSIDWSSKKEGDFSLARTAVRIAPNHGARPLRHHLIIIDVYAYRAERVAKLLDLYRICRDGHFSLNVQLLAELKPSCGESSTSKVKAF